MRMTGFGAENFHPSWLIISLFGINANLAIALFGVMALRLFWLKSDRIPRLMSIWFVMGAGIAFIDMLLVQLLAGPMAIPTADADPFKAIMRSAIAVAIWLTYFNKSNRVRNTFVEPV